jgi:hypothetical protein
LSRFAAGQFDIFCRRQPEDTLQNQQAKETDKKEKVLTAFEGSDSFKAIGSFKELVLLF